MRGGERRKLMDMRSMLQGVTTFKKRREWTIWRHHEVPRRLKVENQSEGGVATSEAAKQNSSKPHADPNKIVLLTGH